MPATTFFFDDIFDLLGEKDSRAQIIIWCRDSLLTSSTSFAEFLDIYTDLDLIRVFRLTRWDRKHKRMYAWQRTKKRRPKSNEYDPAEVSTFLAALDNNQTLKSLSSLPFYSELIFNRMQESGIPTIRDDVELLNSVIDDMVKREKKKGLLDESNFVQHGLEDWMEAIAVEFLDGKGYTDTAQTREFGEYVLKSDLSVDTRENILNSLIQFPLFSSSEEGTGRIAFAHELIAQALAARSYLKEMSRERERTTVFDRLTSIDFDDPVLLRFIASRCTPKMTTYILGLLRGGGISEAAYGAVLFLLLLVRPEHNLVIQENLQFAGKNLAGIPIENRDCSGQSFVECNLYRVRFKNCNLSDASFEGALLNQTHFIDCNLANARFGNVNRIESISFGGNLIHDFAVMRKKISQVTGMAEVVPAEACPTALQVVQLFTKFVNSLGQSRRRRLDKRGLLAGRRFDGAASAEDCIRELVQSEYFKGPDVKDRFLRGEDDAYREMIAAVKDRTLSKGLILIVGKLCRRKGCSHQVC